MVEKEHRMSEIIKQFEEKIPFTDHVYVTQNKHGKPTLRTKNETVMPKGTYTLWLEGAEKEEGFGMLYLGISHTKNQTARQGVKNRWISHAWKLTGLSYKNRSNGKRQQGGRAADTELYANFRKVLVEKGYDLDTILDKLYFRFINLNGVGKEKIAQIEGRILETRIAKGQCRLNGAKRRPALSIEELEYFDHL
jgi:hypothetical protein